MGVKKYFLAIIIPTPFIDEIETIKEKLHTEHGLKGALRSPAHITLHRPFEWKEEKEEFLIEKLRSFCYERPFNIELNGFGAFEPRVIFVNVLQNEFLTGLHSELKKFAQKELKLMNEVNDLRAFHPHVTVASRDLKKNKFDMVWQEYKNRIIEISFVYGGFSLLKLEDKWRERWFFER